MLSLLKRRERSSSVQHQVVHETVRYLATTLCQVCQSICFWAWDRARTGTDIALIEVDHPDVSRGSLHRWVCNPPVFKISVQLAASPLEQTVNCKANCGIGVSLASHFGRRRASSPAASYYTCRRFIFNSYKVGVQHTATHSAHEELHTFRLKRGAFGGERPMLKVLDQRH